MRTQDEERRMREFAFGDGRDIRVLIVGHASNFDILRAEKVNAAIRLTASKWGSFIEDEFPRFPTQTNFGMLQKLAEPESETPDVVKAEAHARAVAVLGPKRGRWK